MEKDNRKYYKAYDERYKTIHSLGKSWASDISTAIVLDTCHKYNIDKSSSILEIGCGEGRDSKVMFEEGYNLIASDVSSEVITYCKKLMPDYEDKFRVLDCLSNDLNAKFDFIFSVAVIHMLVPDDDRNGFYNFIHKHLSENGIALICSMGDGEIMMQSDIANAFILQERIHESDKITVAGTSCRMVSWAEFENEITRNALTIIEKGITSSLPDFSSLMYVVVKKK